MFFILSRIGPKLFNFVGTMRKEKKYLCKFEFQLNGQFIRKKPTNLLLDKGDTTISFGQFLNKKCVQPITRN